MITVRRIPFGWVADIGDGEDWPLPLTQAATIEDAIAHMQGLFPDASVSGAATPEEYAAITE